MSKNNCLKRFREKIKAAGLKQSAQRDQIAREFFKTGEHLDAETLYHRMKKINPKIGHTTVYRTLKLLCEFNMALAHSFAQNITVFEPLPADAKHHDHLICVCCNKIIEFQNSEIEQLQESVAAKYQFQIKRHVLQIYGLCKECAEATDPDK